MGTTCPSRAYSLRTRPACCKARAGVHAAESPGHTALHHGMLTHSHLGDGQPTHHCSLQAVWQREMRMQQLYERHPRLLMASLSLFGPVVGLLSMSAW